MGLRELVVAGIKSGLTAIGNMKETVTYKAYLTTSTYNTTTGAVTRTETSYTINGVFDAYTKREVDGSAIMPYDQKFIFHQSELAVTPTLQDRITRSDGKSWEVVWVKQDSQGATWELQLRAIHG